MAVELIPDTFMKVGKYDIAVQWCERILKDHPDKIDITNTISKKQDEIVSEKFHYEVKEKRREIALIGAFCEPCIYGSAGVLPKGK
jgi:hypothetical protein